MRPIPADSLGHAHGLLRAIDKRGRLRTDEFVTEFSLEELFPADLENALGRMRHFISYARAAGLVKEDRGVVELTEIGRRYIRSGEPDAPFAVSPQQAEWLRRQLREKHMTDSIFHGLAIGLSLLASTPPPARVSTMDFGRSMAYLGRAGWDNENTLQSQGERHLILLGDMELIDAEHRLTATGDIVRGELSLPVHMSLPDIAAQLNPGGADAVRAAAEQEWAEPLPPAPAAVVAPPAPPAPAEDEADEEDNGYHTVADFGSVSPAKPEEDEPARPPIVPRTASAPSYPGGDAPSLSSGDPLAGPPPSVAPPAPAASGGDPLAAEPPVVYPPPIDDAPVSPTDAPTVVAARTPHPSSSVAPPSSGPPAAEPGQAAPAQPAEVSGAPSSAPPAAVAGPVSSAPPVSPPPAVEPPAVAAGPAAETPPVAEPPAVGPGPEAGAPPVAAPGPASSAPPLSPHPAVEPPEAVPGPAAGAPSVAAPASSAPPLSPHPAVEPPAVDPEPAAGAPPVSSPPYVEPPVSSPPHVEPPAAVAGPAAGAPPVSPPVGAAGAPPAAAPASSPPAVAEAAVAAVVPGPAPSVAPPPRRAPFVAAHAAFVEAWSIRAAAEETGLRLPDGVYANVAAALNAGKHLVLTGAPGSGKTSLALAVARAAAQAGHAKGATVVTGAPSRGLLTDAAARGRWVIVDELDQADPDAALKPLSTLLAGVPVTLEGEEAEPAAGWRIVATWNGSPPRGASVLRRFAAIDVTRPPADELRALLKQQDPIAQEAVEMLLALGLPLGAGVLLEAANHIRARQAAVPTDASTLADEVVAAYISPVLDL